MEISIYEYDSLLISLNNLAITKMFHDSGIDVTNFPCYVENYFESGGSVTIDICREGFSKLFEEFYEYSAYDDPVPERYYSLLSHSYDYVFVIKDSSFKNIEVVSSPLERISSMCDMNVKALHSINESGIMIAFDYFCIDAHLMVEELLSLYSECKKNQRGNAA